MFGRKRFVAGRPSTPTHAQMALLIFAGLCLYTVVVAVVLLQGSPAGAVRVYVPTSHPRTLSTTNSDTL